MARSFDVSTKNSASVAKVHAAFAAEPYWRDRLRVYGGDSITLDALVVDDEGVIEVSTTQQLSRDVLPSVLARAVPAGLRLRRSEIWRPPSGGAVRGEIKIVATGLTGSAIGSADLTPLTSGSALRFAGTVKVGVPLVGGQIEKYIIGQIANEIPGVGRFTDDWIAAHG